MAAPKPPQPRCPRCGNVHPATAPCPPKNDKATRSFGNAGTVAATPVDTPVAAVRPIANETVPVDPLKAAAAKLMGRLIEGKYRIEQVIGAGGMGAVYRGEHVRLQRAVAVKVLLNAYRQGSQEEQRFYREARIAGSIGHPNIPEVFDLGTLEDGSPFLVMELLEGQSLLARIEREGQLPIADVIKIGDEMLSALAAAHEKGIVHRDIKPDNVFLARRAGGLIVAKLLDFGISKNLRDHHSSNLTDPGLLMGTPVYLAPEQARLDPNLDHRVDIWAAGVTFYEMLTGSIPFDASNIPELITKILFEPAVRPKVIRPEIPEWLETIVLRAMERNAADRWQSAHEMRAALQRGAGTSTKSSRPAASPRPGAARVAVSSPERPSRKTAGPKASIPDLMTVGAEDDLPDLGDAPSARINDIADIGGDDLPDLRAADDPGSIPDLSEDLPDLGSFDDSGTHSAPPSAPRVPRPKR
jgi:serine/threonine-protein kinase